ncbi:MAG: glycoside hydrolase family 16 protein [Bacillota bacterium]
MKKTTLLKPINLFAAVVLSLPAFFNEGCQVNEEILERENNSVSEDPGPEAVVAIKDLAVSGSEFLPGDIVSTKLTVDNQANGEKTFFIGCSIQDPLGSWYELSPKQVTLESGEKTLVDFAWRVPAGDEKEKLTSGTYRLVKAAWSKAPGEEGTERLATVEKEQAFHVSRYHEDFSTYNEDLWEKSSHLLGLGNLNPDNVKIEDNLLKITLPAGTFDGGQLESRENAYHYGSYRARMKLPEAPSSITGFFLYKAPCFYYEVDIEVVNDTTGKAWFTTYAEGEVTNTCETYLGFDPTEDFHEYRFDFYPGEVSFYVDGELLKTFEESLPGEPMKLMINSWFPHWLDASKPEEDAVTLIDWIKY